MLTFWAVCFTIREILIFKLKTILRLLGYILKLAFLKLKKGTMQTEKKKKRKENFLSHYKTIVNLYTLPPITSLPRWCSDKNLPVKAGDARNMGSIPGLG